jgi:membrane associated rhomboid family serine protease
MARGRRRFDWKQLRITRGAMWLLFVELGVSLVFLLLDDETRYEMAKWMVATSSGVWSEGKVWTLVTSPLLQPELIALLFHGLILWMFVPTLERWWGTKRFLLFALYTSLAGTIAGTLAGALIGGNWALSGLDPFIFASIVAFGVLYARQPVQFFGVLPMTGRQLMWGIIAFSALFVILGQQWALAAAYAASMGLAYLMTSGKWTPKLAWLKWKQRRARRRLKVVRGGDDEPKRWIN